MPERFEDKVSRKWEELKMNAMKSIFKWAIEQYDKLHDGEFLAFSWGIDEVTDYHVIVERSYPDHNVYGTKVTWYESETPKEET